MRGRVMEMVARKMNVTDFGSEMPSKRGKTIASVGNNLYLHRLSVGAL